MFTKAAIHSFLDKFIQEGLAEDVGDGDHTSLACIPPTNINKAKLLCKADGIIAGVEVAKQIFEASPSKFEMKIYKRDGDEVRRGDIAFTIEGSSREILQRERLALNTMQRMSGIATMSKRYTDVVEDLPVKILDTRKTTPLLRFLEKWAVSIGGATNYRYGLFDRIMIKDNHIDACGSIEKALTSVQEYLKTIDIALPITIEIRNFAELDEALLHGAFDRIMLDNFSIPQLRKAIAIIDHEFETEASGGITLRRLRKVAETGVDFISIGALTHSFKSLDMSLKVMD
ncbi:MAG: carboxylating nicotinate-nucleotide diphosphorylase [Bacteroidia bacterium]|nr:carboxylating nicotinate-nucleotide diphosphorylase [Bacteroidia bacterium]